MSVSRPLRDERHDFLQERPAITLIERHLLTRGCMLRTLRIELSDYEPIGLATAQDLVRIAGRNVRLVLLNIEHKAVTDPAVLRDIELVGHTFPNAPIGLLSHWDDGEMSREAIRRGAKGFLPISTPVEIALAAVRLILAGGVYYPGPVSVASDAAFQEMGDLETVAPLTEPRPSVDNDPRDATLRVGGFTRREAQVLAALQRGRSNKVIAAELNMSENTVKVHIRHIMRKLRASNRTEAAIMAQQRAEGGLVTELSAGPFPH